jgi:hypothetical protein
MPAILDLTRAWIGTEADVFGRVVGAFAPNQLSPLEVIGTERQREQVDGALASHGATFLAVGDPVSEGALVDQVRTSIERLLASQGIVRVFSFSPHIRALVQQEGNRHPGRVLYEPLNSPELRAASPAAARLTWDSSFMPEDEAVEIVLRAVGASPTGRVKKSDLRSVLELADPRFSKASNPFAASTGFISLVVELLSSRGLVDLHGVEPAVVVELTPLGRERALSARRSARAVLDRPSDVSGPRAGGSGPIGATRSSSFIDVLRAARLGPFMNERLDVYEQIDYLVDAKSTPLRRLAAEAVRAVRQSREPQTDAQEPAREPGESSESTERRESKPFPWSRLASFIERLLMERAVAEADGEALQLSWATGDRVVTGMVKDWKLQLDGLLVMRLIDAGLEVSLGDLPDVAGALYGGRDTEETERVWEVVTLLRESGELIVSDGVENVLRRSEVIDGG